MLHKGSKTNTGGQRHTDLLFLPHQLHCLLHFHRKAIVPGVTCGQRIGVSRKKGVVILFNDWRWMYRGGRSGTSVCGK